MLTFDAFGPHPRNASALRSISALRDAPESSWTDVAQHFSYQYQLLPNTSLTFDARHIEPWQILPVAPGTSEAIHTAYLRPGLSPEEKAKATDMAPWSCETAVDGNDFWVAGRTEAGLRTGPLPSVVFGRNEPAPQHLHRGFAAAWTRGPPPHLPWRTEPMDLLLRDGLLIDGTGTQVVSLDGLVLAPGFIDIHTHYDAQILWDGDLTPSSWHGVTSVVMGNCGFGVAPTKPEHRDTIVRTLENVEGMSAEALNAGIDWCFETFPSTSPRSAPGPSA